MNIIRGILIALLVAGLTLFSVANSQFVTIDLGFQTFNIWLPLLVLLAFTLGFLPVWLRLSADRMILKRRTGKLEASLAKAEGDLAQARVELLRPPAAAPLAPSPPPQTVPHPAPPPGT